MLAAFPGADEIGEALDAARLSASKASSAADALDNPSYSRAMLVALPGGEATSLAEIIDVSRFAVTSSFRGTRGGAPSDVLSKYPTVLFGMLGGSIIGAVAGNSEISGGPGSLKCGAAGGLIGGILGLAWDMMDFLIAKQEGPKVNEGGDHVEPPPGDIIELPEPALEKMHQLALTAVALSDYEEARAKLKHDLGEQLTERTQEKKARDALEDIVDRIDSRRKEPMNQSEGDFKDIQEVLSEGDTAEFMTAEAALANNALVTANDLARVSGKNGTRLRGEDIGPAGDLESFQGDMIPASEKQASLFQMVARHFDAGSDDKDVVQVAAGEVWPNAVVNFCFASDVSPRVKHIFLAAANQYKEAIPCLSFVDVGLAGGSSRSEEDEQRCNASPAIFVQSNPNEGCYSYVGVVSGKPSQRLQLQDPGCLNIGTTVHELGHALGMAHEQSRPDRDKHVKIHWDNIAYNKRHNFAIEEKGYTGEKYDLLSIMHYDRYAFAVDYEKPTIEYVGEGVHDELGQRAGLSSYDVSQLVAMYEVTNKDCKGNDLAGMGCIDKPDDSGKDICDVDKCNSKAASHCCACGGGIEVQCYEGQDCPKADPLPDLEASECMEDATHLFQGGTVSYPCIYTNVCKFNVQFKCAGFECVHKVRSKNYEVAKCNNMFVTGICFAKDECKVTKITD